MNSFGEPVMPSRTRCDQNWRETWNCSLIVTALAGSTRPSGPAGLLFSSHSAERPVPALFHPSELSPATPAADSKTVTVQEGATTPSSDARVALMMPPPTRTTSGLALSGTGLSATTPGSEVTSALLGGVPEELLYSMV